MSFNKYTIRLILQERIIKNIRKNKIIKYDKSITKRTMNNKNLKLI
jgi:hypothetical protein